MMNDNVCIKDVCKLPSVYSELPGKLFSFESFDNQHIAITFGSYSEQKSPYVRIHSECLTGDVLGSLRCDCGSQLKDCLKLISTRGGILIYLRQEGRGIGLYNKIASYQLQEQGANTYDANSILGFQHDLRTYYEAASMLKALGVRKINLLTNNPQKVQHLQESGIHVSRVPLGSYINKHNKSYISDKIIIGGHYES